MGWLSIIGVILNILQGLISRASAQGQMDAGAKAQLADGLLATAGMVADGKKIAEWVAKQPPDVIDSILQQYYTRDKESS